MNVANFFWHGSLLSLYERACLASFVHHGFRVRLWTYRPLEVPQGVERCDAGSILPEADIARFTQAGVKGSVTSFSNAFRYRLLAEHGGWWFDTDVFCLKPSDQFIADREFVIGWEDVGIIATGVMRVPASFARLLYDEVLEIGVRNGWTFRWGEIGPKMLTTVAVREGVDHHAFPKHVFYPMGPVHALSALDPERAGDFEAACAQAHTYHLWNEVIRQHAIPKMLMPPEGSYLHTQFVRIDPSLAALPALPVETLRRLSFKPEPVPLHSIKFLSRTLWTVVKRRYL